MKRFLIFLLVCLPQLIHAQEPENEDEDSWGIFWLEAQAGYSYANLIQFRSSNFIPEAENLQGNGITAGGALGFRLYLFTIGVRANFSHYSDFNLSSAALDLGVHLPIPLVSPYLRVGFGYGWLGGADWDSTSLRNASVQGLVIDGGLGVNIKLAPILSLGGGFDAAFLNLGRQSIRDAGSIATVDLEEDGDAVGLQIRVHLHLTIHI